MSQGIQGAEPLLEIPVELGDPHRCQKTKNGNLILFKRRKGFLKSLALIVFREYIKECFYNH